MDPLTTVDDLLDFWETRSHFLSLDQFVAEHCPEVDQNLLTSFRTKAESLRAIDRQLAAIGDANDISRPIGNGPLSSIPVFGTGDKGLPTVVRQKSCLGDAPSSDCDQS